MDREIRNLSEYEGAALMLFVGIMANFIILLTGNVTDLAVQTVMLVSSVAGAFLLALMVRRARAIRREQG